MPNNSVGTHTVRNRYLLIADILSCAISYFFAMIFWFSPNWSVIPEKLLYVVPTFLLAPAVYVLFGALFGIYRCVWLHAGSREYSMLLIDCAVSAICSTAAGKLLNRGISIKMHIFANIFCVVMVLALRFAVRLIGKSHQSKGTEGGRRVLVIGAGRLALLLLRDIYESTGRDMHIVGLIDDDKQKKHSYIYGQKVLGDRGDIVRICEEKGVDEIIFAISDIDPHEKVTLLELCGRTGCKVRIVHGVAASDGSEAPVKGILREVEIEDLLERAPIRLDNALIGDVLHDRVVMVTGGGGSIGSELCRQIARFSPKLLVIVDIYENTTYELQHELEETFPELNMAVLIASVRDRARLDTIMETYRPYIVFHAAAHKHVPLMEFSPCEAIKNNCLGTYNTARSAMAHGVKRFVLISTDKAVNPTNIMGASKRVCEMVVQTLQKYGETEFAAVRFGNVLGSNGSVIPRFKKQIAAGGPVTVTHPDITRFFMTIPEAAQLVLQAAAYAKGGEIFVLDMGKPVKIADLAAKLITLSGYKVDEDIKIVYTGLRAGEKLYEELLMNEEGLTNTEHAKIFVGKPIDITPEELESKLEKLKNAVERGNDAVRDAIAEVVPTYHPGPKAAQREKTAAAANI